MNFGERLRLARNAKRLNQTQLGDAADIAQSYISELESLEEAPPKTNLSKIADALEVSEGYLRYGHASSIINPPLISKNESSICYFKNLKEIINLTVQLNSVDIRTKEKRVNNYIGSGWKVIAILPSPSSKIGYEMYSDAAIVYSLGWFEEDPPPHFR